MRSSVVLLASFHGKGIRFPLSDRPVAIKEEASHASAERLRKESSTRLAKNFGGPYLGSGA